MDHIKIPFESQVSPIVVGYFCTAKFDGGTFLNYPERQGWTEVDLFFRPNWNHDPNTAESRSDKLKTEEEATSFAQNWLYFCLLENVLGPRVQVDDFLALEQGDKTATITTAKLVEYAHYAAERWSQMSPDELVMEHALIDRVLTRANRMFIFICGETTLNPELLFSIAILGDFLTYIRNAVLWRGDPRRGHELMLHWPSGCFMKSIIAKRMLERNWCPEAVVRALRLTPSARYIITHMAVPRPVKAHDKCLTDRCLAYQLDWSTYKTAHTSLDCRCDFLFANQADLVEILDKDEIPVVNVQQLTACGFVGSIPIVSQTTVSHYVAISHVWSDHMGNNRANALPVCQLRYLAECVRGLYLSEPDVPALWMDTICCPVQPRSARTKAIILMRQTYEEADKVLVVENYLRNCQTTDTISFEPFARIYLSTWNTRLWTLQEGMLAKALYVQLADKAISLDDEWAALIRSNAAVLEFHNILTFPVSIRGGFSSVSRIDTIYNARIAVHTRFTSWASDEPLCLSILLGLDSAKLLDGPIEGRMKRFWELLPYIPSYVVFWTGSRLADQGFQWAPATFLNSRLETFLCNTTSAFEGERKHATRTSQGLEVVFPGCTLRPMAATQINRQFFLRDSQGRFRYWLRTTPDRELSDSRLMDIHTASPDQIHELAIIAGCPLRLTSEPGREYPDEVEGVLVKVISKSVYSFVVKILSTCTICTASLASIPAYQRDEAIVQTEIVISRDQQTPYQHPVRPIAALLHKTLAEFSVPEMQEELDAKQKWCIV